jgi:hypothetical protein
MHTYVRSNSPILLESDVIACLTKQQIIKTIKRCGRE